MRKLLSLLLVACLLLGVSGTCSAAYQITETELTQLQQNLTQLETLNNQQLIALSQSKQDCQTLKTQLIESQNQIQTLKSQLTELQNQSTKTLTELQTAQESLNSANKSLLQYEKEVETEQSRLTWQRNLFAGACIYLLVK